MASLMAQTLKNLPAMQETPVLFLGQEGSPGEGMGHPLQMETDRDPATLMAKSEEELKSPLMRVKEKSEKAGLKFNLLKTKIMASGPITSWKIDGETGNSDRLYFLGFQNHCRW